MFYSYVLVFYPYVTGMYISRMYSYVARMLFFLLLLKLYLFTLTPSAIADFQGGRDNKKKTIYIMQIKTVKLKYDVRID